MIVIPRYITFMKLLNLYNFQNFCKYFVNFIHYCLSILSSKLILEILQYLFFHGLSVNLHILNKLN